jgi:tRNA-Thr(GGU) m(6)t(6)A37 methyltransferase TsaA
MQIHLEAIGIVRASRTAARDDHWGASESSIELTGLFEASALAGLEEFSHVEVLFLFHGVDPEDVTRGRRHPRNNPAWPEVGIFAQRAKNRPNRIGSTICPIQKIQGRSLWVKELDAIDGTPVLDLKPVLAEFLPRSVLRQPAWSKELMRDYWAPERSRPAR